MQRNDEKMDERELKIKMNNINFCNGTGYFEFKNDSSTKAYIYVFGDFCKLCLENDNGCATYATGNPNLIFREYLKNWNECKIFISLGIYNEDKEELKNLKDMDGDFIFSRIISGKVKSRNFFENF